MSTVLTAQTLNISIIPEDSTRQHSKSRDFQTKEMTLGWSGSQRKLHNGKIKISQDKEK